jgi:hypothetical protein
MGVAPGPGEVVGEDRSGRNDVDPDTAGGVVERGDLGQAFECDALDYSRDYSRNYFRPPLRLAQLHQDRCATRCRDAGVRPRTGVQGHQVSAS